MKKSPVFISAEVKSTLDYFIVLSTLGKGSSAKVKLVQDPYTSTTYAAKIIKLNSRHSYFESRSRLLSEVKLVSKQNHPNIIKLKDYQESGTYLSKSKGFYSCMYLLFEYCPMGDLFKLLKKNGPLPSRLSHYLFSQILQSLSYLHSQGLIHGDLKPENLVISAAFELKIIDFELSFKQGEGKYLGSERYLSPEVRSNNLSSSFKSDLFSLGLILFILILGSPPFVKSSEDDPFYNLFKNNREGFWNYFEKKRPGIEITKEFKELIEGLLQHDPEKRWGYQEILNNQWVSQTVDKETAVDSLKTMLI